MRLDARGRKLFVALRKEIHIIQLVLQKFLTLVQALVNLILNLYKKEIDQWHRGLGKSVSYDTHNELSKIPYTVLGFDAQPFKTNLDR